MSLEWLQIVTSEAISLIVHLAYPMLVAAVLAGAVIAIFQAATQVQEQTLSFVPKILVTFYVVYVQGPYIGQSIRGFLLKRLDEIIWIAAGYKN